jgi:hypothetical protein
MPPELKIRFWDPIMGPYNPTKFQIETTLPTPSKVAVTEVLAKHNSISSDFFQIIESR